MAVVASSIFQVLEESPEYALVCDCTETTPTESAMLREILRLVKYTYRLRGTIDTVQALFRDHRVAVITNTITDR